MRKVDNGKRENRKEKEKIMSFLVATNVVASRTDWNADRWCQFQLRCVYTHLLKYDFTYSWQAAFC